ncbi:MAG: efflux RND transporter periplasmic adaptor subunit [bacterium]
MAVEAVVTGDIASYYHATATLEAEKEAEILARVSGVIGSLACEEGDRVNDGQAMLRIDNDQYALRLQQTEAATASLRARHDRLARMLEEDLTSTEEYETVRSELAAGEADLGLARLDVSYTTVAAPFTGKVVERLVDVGQNVSEGTPLFRIADFEPLLARVHVPSREFKKLEQDQPVQLVLDSNRERVSGRIKLISPVIDPTSGTIKLTLEIPEYPASTRPGDFAEVHIVTERRIGSLLVPRSAVVTEKGEEIVYIAINNSAERRSVTVGFTDSDNAEILSGVAAGELVVTKGQRSLKHGVPLKILEGPPGTTADETAVGADTGQSTPAGGGS